MIKLSVSPAEVSYLLEAMVIDYEGETTIPLGQGFLHKELIIPYGMNDRIIINTSYDGESELLAEIIEKPEDMSIERAEIILRKLFD
jgi:hypothetical protein